ncbi:hypothetical protein ACLOJK_024709 [Asimina triloba]
MPLPPPTWPSMLSRRFSHQPLATHHHQIMLLCTQGKLKPALSALCAPKSHLHHPQIYAAFFRACAHYGFLAEGRALHSYMLANNHHPHNLFLTNHLINMYAKCGCMNIAHKLFDEMPHRNLVSWTALITGYDQNDRPDECFNLFASMLSYCFLPNEFAFASVLRSCNAGDRGAQVHALALKLAFDGNVYVGNALITMYSRCCDGSGGCDSAWLVFQNLPVRTLVTWNSMIAGFDVAGCADWSIHLFSQMHRDGFGFDRSTMISTISSCREGNNVGSSFKHLQQLHCLALKAAFLAEIEIVTALIKSYSNVGQDADECYQLFLETKENNRDIVSWTGTIALYAECQPAKAFFLFCCLHQDGFSLDRYTFSIVVKACAGLVTERHGLAVHALIMKVGFGDDRVLANALIHAYARCGSIDLAEQIFNHMQDRDAVSWNSMIKAYAMHGRAADALQVFASMGAKPDDATFVGLLSACAHAGLVDRGREIFKAMSENYGIIPQCDHFACMVDVLGRAGCLAEAEDLINQMPVPPDHVVWSALLGACQKHREITIGERAARKLIELQPKNSAGYVMISNIYCASGSFSDAGFIRKEMIDCRTKKEAGLSWIEIGSQVNEFAAGGWRHPQREAIYLEIRRVVHLLKQMGYVPETSLVLHEVDEEHKEEQLYHHSEKLALAFGLMNAARCAHVEIIGDQPKEGNACNAEAELSNACACCCCFSFVNWVIGLMHAACKCRFHSNHLGFDGINMVIVGPFQASNGKKTPVEATAMAWSSSYCVLLLCRCLSLQGFQKDVRYSIRPPIWKWQENRICCCLTKTYLRSA